MTDSRRSSRSEDRLIISPTRDLGFYAQGLLLLGALVAVFLAGGPSQGGMGIFLLTAGIGLIVIRSPLIAPWVCWGLSILLLICSFAALMPQEWLKSPGVRASIRPVPILLLPESISLDPRATIFWIVVFALTLLIALFLLATPSSSKRMYDLALIATVGCSLYALLALKSWQTGWVYPFFEKPSWSQPAFGFFHNRNHTAGFLVSGAIVSLGVIHRGLSGRGMLRPLLAACCFATLVCSLLFVSISRAGLLLLVLGVLIWLCGLGRHRSMPLLVGVLALGLALMTLFMGSESGLLQRLKGNSSRTVVANGELSVRKPVSLGEMRVKIWEDSFSLIKEYPLTGTGFASFPHVYPFYADKSLRDQSTALHAESDWITLAAENGIPMLIIAIGSIVWLISRIPIIAAEAGRQWPLRWAFLAAFLTELLHGMVDVPLHKPELGWWVLVLGGIGFSGLGNKGGVIQYRFQRAVFVLGGIASLLLGAGMIRAQWYGGDPLPPFAPPILQKQIAELYGSGDSDSVRRATDAARRAIRQYPMEHAFYFQLAKILLDSNKKSAEAAQLLETEQAVYPIDPDVVFIEGWLISPFDPMVAASFWNEAIRRQQAYDDSPNSVIRRTGELYRQMISKALGNWSLFDRLPALASNSELRMIWLANPYCPAIQVAEAARDANFMDQLSDKEKGQVFELWWQRGDRAQVDEFLKVHPEYQKAAISTLLRIFKEAGEDEKSCKLLAEIFEIPIGELNSTSVVTPTGEANVVPDNPLDAANYFLKNGNPVTARHYLDEAVNGPKRIEALRLRAVLEMGAGDWTSALEDLVAYLKSEDKL